MKAQTTVNSDNTVTLSYDDELMGERVTRRFNCPTDGGYVREFVRGSWEHACRRLSYTGPRLTCEARTVLADTLRRELRAKRNSDRKVLA